MLRAPVALLRCVIAAAGARRAGGPCEGDEGGMGRIFRGPGRGGMDPLQDGIEWASVIFC